jgi:hypothetical protein
MAGRGEWALGRRRAYRRMHFGSPEISFMRFADAIAQLQHLPPAPHEQRGRLLESLARPGCFSRERSFRL